MPELPSLDSWEALGQTTEGGLITLPSSWDDALARACGTGGWWVESQEILMRRMMREECIFSTDRIYRALVVEGDHSISGAVEDPGKIHGNSGDAKRFKRSEEALVFTQAWVDRLTYSLKALCHDLLEAESFGHKLAEAEFGPFALDVAPFKGAINYIAPVDLSPKPRTVYKFVVDNSNRVAGVRGRQQVTENIIPAANLLWLTVGGTDRDPRGGGILPSLWETYADKARARKNQGAASDQSGGGFLVIEQDYPKEGEYRSYADVPDGSGKMKPDGTPVTKTIAVQRIAAMEARKAKTGSAAVLMPGQRMRMMQADGSMTFDSQLDRYDRAIIRAYLGNARMLQEAQNGSKADTQEAGDVGETMRDTARGRLSEAIERFFGSVLNLNFGDKYADVVPKYGIVTEEGSDSVGILTVLATAGAKMAFNLNQLNWMIAKAGGPPYGEDDMQTVVDPAADPANPAVPASDPTNPQPTPTAVKFKRKPPVPKETA